MAYIGNTPAEAYTSIDKQTITGDGGASYTLDHAVANENEIEVFVNNVRQEPSVAYTVSGTALTMTGNVESSDDFYVVFQGKAIQTTSHPEGHDLKARDGTFSGAVELTGETQTLTITDNSSSNNVQLAAGNSAGYFRVDSGNNATSPTMRFEVGGSEKMRIEDGGNVGIGTSSPSSDATLHLASGSSNKPHVLLENTVSSGGDPGITFADSVENYGYRIGADDSGNAFVITYKSGGINPIHGTDDERMRIGSATTTLTHGVNNNYALQVDQDTSGANAYGVAIRYTSSNNDNHNGEFIHCEDTTATRFMVKNDGDVQNHDNAYGGISDQKVKEQIADASSQWDDIKALQIRKYKMKDDVANADADSDALFKLGVIAQELEAAGMSGLVSSSPDFDSDGNDLGTVTKGVKYSILYMKAVKALQEAIAKIEALETRVQALEDA